MKKLIILWAFVFVGFYAMCHSESDNGETALRTLQSDGDRRCPFAIIVGTGTPQTPFAVCFGTTTRTMRNIYITNPASSYYLMVGTFSSFSVGDKWFPIYGASETWKSYNHQTLWLRYPPGGSSETVRGTFESE